jgi:hypothetical protein
MVYGAKKPSPKRRGVCCEKTFADAARWAARETLRRHGAVCEARKPAPMRRGKRVGINLGNSAWCAARNAFADAAWRGV